MRALAITMSESKTKYMYLVKQEQKGKENISQMQQKNRNLFSVWQIIRKIKMTDNVLRTNDTFRHMQTDTIFIFHLCLYSHG